jgi:hypothetical protein
MIKITGSSQRSFIFPADLDTTIAFFSDIGRILHYLPYISIVNKYSEQRYRMLYSSKEMGLYRVNIYCDLIAELRADQRIIRFEPFDEGVAPVRAKAGIYSLVSRGYYSSISKFIPIGDESQIEYELKLEAELPVPLGVQFMPDGVVERLARNIVQGRMQEIIDGFIMRSIRAYHLLNQEHIR